MTAASPKTNPGEIIAAMRDVTVTFDGYQTRALARVNLDIRRGEVLGVLGPRGAGKSTVLEILAGRVGPTEGTVKVFGRSPRRGGTRARIGYLSDASDSGKPRGFFQRLFAGKNVSLQISRGSSRLTQAVLGNRDLLILDEPFAGLGAAEKAETKTLIRELAGRGKTVVLSSDSLMDIKDLCQRIAIFHEGKVQAAGTLTELLAVGGAIRFFPAVLPRETVERVLKVLREEILDEPISAQGAAAVVEVITSKTPAQEKESKTAEGVMSKPLVTDSIDHEKLAGLTKPGAPN